MADDALTRSQFLTRTAAAIAGAAIATAPAASARIPRRLVHRGVAYEVADGATPATSWNAARMRRDLAAIAGDLHANTVSVFGTGVERLLATTEEAVQQGLHVWLQPRLGDVPGKDILDHLGETGRWAEELRRHGASIDPTSSGSTTTRTFRDAPSTCARSPGSGAGASRWRSRSSAPAPTRARRAAVGWPGTRWTRAVSG
jgi:hypothetical protein